MQALYCEDFWGLDASAAALRELEDTYPSTPDADEFAHALVDGVRRHRADLDARIAHAATNWNLHRIAPTERNVLRIGIYELLLRPDIPAAVTINELVELAKRFGTEKSGGFVNGVLDKVNTQIAAERSGEATPQPS
jgi:N utilization substance protein B